MRERYCFGNDCTVFFYARAQRAKLSFSSTRIENEREIKQNFFARFARQDTYIVNICFMYAFTMPTI